MVNWPNRMGLNNGSSEETRLKPGKSSHLLSDGLIENAKPDNS